VNVSIDSCGTITGPKRAVLEVLRLKKGSGLNYALKLECGHTVGRRLLRDASHVRCYRCSKEAARRSAP
jgi:hypothetical protein